MNRYEDPGTTGYDPRRRGGRHGSNAMPEYSFDKVIEEGLRLKANTNRESTQKTDAFNAKDLLRFFTGYWITYDPMTTKRKLLTPERIDQYITFREAEGVGVAGIRRELGLGSACISLCAKKKHWMMPNVFANPDLEQPEARDREATNEEIAALLLAADQPFEDMILCWLATWCRPSELRELKWTEVHGDHVELVIQKSDRVVRGKRREGKQRRKPFALTPFAQEIIKRQPKVSTAVFTKDGLPITYHQLQWMMRKTRRKAAVTVPSVATLQIRDLRRTAGTWAREVPGIDLEDIASQYRHSSTRMAEKVYTKPALQRAARAAGASNWHENVMEAMKELQRKLG